MIISKQKNIISKCLISDWKSAGFKTGLFEIKGVAKQNRFFCKQLYLFKHNKFIYLKHVFNYGLDKVRFINPVNVGSKVRTHSKVVSVDDKGDGRYLIKIEITMEIEGIEKPAFVAESLSMFIT